MWADKSPMIKRANDWLNFINTNYPKLVQYTIDTTKIVDFDKTGLPEVANHYAGTNVSVVPADSIDGLQYLNKYKKTGILNFADYYVPGGMFLKGSTAQEEFLCHNSTLYLALCSKQDTFYTPHVQHCTTALYRNDMLATDRCWVFDANRRMQCCSIITCAAPYKTKVAMEDLHLVDETLRVRIDHILRQFAVMQCEQLVLGAYGCGVFSNNPYFVADVFKNWIKNHNGVFEHVVFAIPKGSNYYVFMEVFKQ